ncbi:MAG: hypothetical protein ACE15F_08405 [bacterium]
MSREARIYKTFATVLLTVCSVFITATVFLGAYLFFRLHDIRLLRTQLLNTYRIQEELMKDSGSNLVIYPHRIGAIGYVLNPFLKEGTLWAPAGSSYAINPLGLRGEPIESKPPGVKRILLLGDSWFFGWFLKEDEKLAPVLRQLLDEKGGSHPCQVITAAVPGWNTQCEAAFLEYHLARLDPDLLVWEAMANDVLDSSGAAPPGVMADFFSPQTPDEAPFHSLGKLNNYPMPFIRSRMRRNLHFIETFLQKYPVPTILMAIDIDPALMGLMKQDGEFRCPILYLPDKYKMDEKRGWVAPGDFHPSPWLNRIMAVGLVNEMAARAWIAPVTWPAAETEIIREFRRYQEERGSEAAVAGYLRQYADWTPVEINADSLSGDAAYGLVSRDKLCERGILYLNVPPDRGRVVFQFEVEASILKYPRRVTVTARDFQGRECQVQHRIEKPVNRVEIPLPQPRSEYPVHEMEWLFDFRECQGPTLCYSAVLKAVSSE